MNVDDPRVIAQMREMLPDGTSVEDYGAFLRMAVQVAAMLSELERAPVTPPEPEQTTTLDIR
jgi:hypothetical protein